MKDYLLLMHGGSKPTGDWGAYIDKLQEAGCFQGGSSIGEGVCATRAAAKPDVTRHLSGYMKIRANDLGHATELLAGNPVYEAGGIVEIRELTRD